jgi:hypothetical protein
MSRFDPNSWNEGSVLITSRISLLENLTHPQAKIVSLSGTQILYKNLAFNPKYHFVLCDSPVPCLPLSAYPICISGK